MYVCFLLLLTCICWLYCCRRNIPQSTATCDWDTLVNHEDEILHAFYDQYMAKTKINKDYTFEQMKEEYIMMCFVVFTYYVGFGAAIFLESEKVRCAPWRGVQIVSAARKRVYGYICFSS